MEWNFSLIAGLLIDLIFVGFWLATGISAFIEWRGRCRWRAKKNADFKKAHSVMVPQTCANCRHCRKTWSSGMRGRAGRMVPAYCRKFGRNIYGNKVCYSKLLEEVEWRVLK